MRIRFMRLHEEGLTILFRTSEPDEVVVAKVEVERRPWPEPWQGSFYGSSTYGRGTSHED